jgi:hypothetical protein
MYGTVEHFGDVANVVAVGGFHAAGGEAHRDDIVPDVGKILHRRIDFLKIKLKNI